MEHVAVTGVNTQLAALVRAAASKTQVVVATQSVTLLDQFDAGEVIVAERSNGASTFRRVDEAVLDDWRQAYSLGEPNRSAMP